MDDRLKDLLQRLLGANVEIVRIDHDGDCGVEGEIGALKARILEIPASTESDERVNYLRLKPEACT
jgi:RNase P/RNase MRP subunit p29